MYITLHVILLRSINVYGQELFCDKSYLINWYTFYIIRIGLYHQIKKMGFKSPALDD